MGILNSFIISLISVLLISSSWANKTENLNAPFFDVYQDKPHSIQIIESGLAALKMRLDLIRKAKKNIELEYFIFSTDFSGKVIISELVKAAQRGVKVRILVDKSISVFKLNEFYGHALAGKNIEVKYYNAAPLIFLSTIQFRNHRKLLSIDDLEAITGGRNIGDDYFDLSEKFNFYDRDIYVKGEVVKNMRITFDRYFYDSISQTVNSPNMPPKTKRVKRAGGKVTLTVKNTKALNTFKEKTELAKSFTLLSEGEKKKLVRIEAMAKLIVKKMPMFECNDLTYASDLPGGDFKLRLQKKYKKEYRVLRKVLDDKIRAIDKSILIVSPYMINNKASRALMLDLMDRNVDITLYTNSLASTDAIYVAANLYKDVLFWNNMGAQTFVHTGDSLAETPTLNKKIEQAKWGIHSKSHVYRTSEYSEIMVGTYNIDNRSNFYNTEMAIFCKGNEALTDHLEKNIIDRANKGYRIRGNGTAVNAQGETKTLFVGSKIHNLTLMALIALPSWFLKVLL